MPELPEVETVRRVLHDSLLNKRISNIDILYSPIIENDDSTFKENIIGKEIIDIKRYGKYLIFCLNKGYILSHLRMEGKYYYLNEKLENLAHIHVIYHFSDGTYLYYKDVRKFGRMEYIEDDIYHSKSLSKMGPDLILSDIDINSIYQKIHKSDKEIKSLLLDQTIVAGLGNIYVDEVLFKAKISPLKKGKEITRKKTSQLILASKEILSNAIIHKGTTIKSYTSSLGVEGNYQNFLQVHTKNICPNCKIALNRVKIKGRMTYYCKECQR